MDRAQIAASNKPRQTTWESVLQENFPADYATFLGIVRDFHAGHPDFAGMAKHTLARAILAQLPPAIGLRDPQSVVCGIDRTWQEISKHEEGSDKASSSGRRKAKSRRSSS